MSVICLEQLSKQYKNGRGIQQVSLRVEPGQIYGLLGPNGSGKTTTMKIMVGLIAPDSGQAQLFGANPQEDPEKALQNVGCLIENPSYYAYLTARENLEIIRKFYPHCPAEQIETVLKQVGLSPYADEKVRKYSLGMKQRLGLAAALLTEPQLLILDEPSNGLDIEGMAEIRQILQHQAENGCTILISSHLAHEIEQICTHVAIIREGCLLSTDKVPDLLANYGSIENYYLSKIHPEAVAVSQPAYARS